MVAPTNQKKHNVTLEHGMMEHDTPVNGTLANDMLEHGMQGHDMTEHGNLQLKKLFFQLFLS